MTESSQRSMSSAFDFVKQIMLRWKVWAGLLAFIGGALGAERLGWWRSETIPIALIVALILASYDVWREQRALIKQAQGEQRRAELSITMRDRTRFILRCTKQRRPIGIYLEFDVLVENRGRRRSVINQFTVSVRELKEQPFDLKPEHIALLQGRASKHALDSTSHLTRSDVLKVGPEDAVGPGILAFYIPWDSDPGECLHCELTLTDTEGSSATRAVEVRAVG